jgi:GT2 family glycosyltransferase
MDQISVVIPTHRRLDALRRTLEALDEQDLGDVEAELVVVCSGSDRAHRDQVLSLAGDTSLRTRVLARAEGGAAGARNAGVGAADTDLILFLNEDTAPLSRELVRSHVELRAGGGEQCGIIGQVVWDPQTEITPVMDWLSRTGKMNDYSDGVSGGERRPMLYAPNLSLPRAAFMDVGGFDERFWRYGWAEYDLTLRLYDRGFEARYVPELVVGHLHTYTLRDSLRRMESVGRGANLFNRVHRARSGLVTPKPAGSRALVGRALAPLSPFVRAPAWLPVPVRDALFRVLHYSMIARGYVRDPVPEGGGRQGQIPGQVEFITR